MTTAVADTTPTSSNAPEGNSHGPAQVAVHDIGTADDFMAAIEGTIKEFNDGDIVQGVIVRVECDMCGSVLSGDALTADKMKKCVCLRPERVAQVLRILLDNALRHTPPGTGVRVSAARSNGHVRLEVSDKGLGIKRQNMPHIFEPFFTSNEEAQGAGLGLAIARELADRMHGDLSVRSGPGHTTFSLVLPT